MKPNTFFAFAYLSLVFFNSFVDLGHKILIQNVFYITETPHMFTIMSAIVNAMILIPYLLMFSPAGFISDKFAKSSVMKITAWAAFPLTGLITLFYFMGWFWPAFAMTLLLAMQSAINSPAKYGYVKEFFRKEAIARANGYVQALTVAAILLATFLFSVFFQHLLSHIQSTSKATLMQDIAPLGFLLMASSLFECIMSLMLPKFKAASPEQKFKFKTYLKGQYVKRNLGNIWHNKTILYCILGLSIFWGINQVIVASYGAYLKAYVAGATPVFVQGTMGIAVIGVILGSVYAGKISKRFIEVGALPVALVGISVCIWLMVTLTSKVAILILFLVYGFFSGLVLVPLNALIQFHAPDKKIGKILAANNFMQTLFMFGFLILTVGLSLIKIDATYLFRLLFIFALLSCVLTVKMLPQSMIRFILYFFVSKFYKLDVYGLNNLPSSGGALLLGNHTSYLDWAAISMASPRPVRFVMDRTIYHHKALNWLFKALKIIPISSRASKQGIKDIQAALAAGDVVCLFPEGHLSRNGQMGQFAKGFERSVAQTDAVIVPFYLHGLWGSATSLADSNFKFVSKDQKRARHITIGFGPELPATTGASIVREKVVELGNEIWDKVADDFQSISRAFAYRAKVQGRNTIMIDAKSEQSLSGFRALAAVMGIKSALKGQVKNSQNVGVLMPSTNAGILANMSLFALGKTVVNLNYTASAEAFAHMIKSANIKTIVSSKQFITKLNARGLETDTLLKGLNLILLEDLNAKLSKPKMLASLSLAVALPFCLLKHLVSKKAKSDDAASILFSSGSEGLPKGVELTHKNIVSNVKQAACVLNLRASDKVLGSLPLFHAFGLTVTSIMPLLVGTPVVFTPDPTDAVAVGRAVARCDVTILCGTCTFLNLYARHPKVKSLMFESLRLVISGAEKLSMTVREQFKEKFNIDIYQGYGSTETAPISSFNLPDILLKDDWHVQLGHKIGTVGLAVPGTTFRIVDPNTFESLPTGTEGMLLVAGPQLMKGYLNQPEKTAEVIKEIDGKRWYISGDKAKLDEDGFLSIVDRYSRFAKVGGEMVSLAAVENALAPIINDHDIAVMSAEDAKKGEQLILFIAAESLDTNQIMSAIRASDINSLWVPKQIRLIPEIPKLGSGKTNFAALKKLVATG